MADAILARCFSPLTIEVATILVHCMCVCADDVAEPAVLPGHTYTHTHRIDGKRRKTCGSKTTLVTYLYVYIIFLFVAMPRWHCTHRKTTTNLLERQNALHEAAGESSWFGHTVLGCKWEQKRKIRALVRFLLTSILSFPAQRDQKWV